MSVAFSLEKIESISGKSSLGGIAPLIKRRRARLLESGRVWSGWYLEATFTRSLVVHVYQNAPRNLVTGDTGMAYIEQMVDEIGVRGQKSKNDSTPKRQPHTSKIPKVLISIFRRVGHAPVDPRCRSQRWLIPDACLQAFKLVSMEPMILIPPL